MTKLFRTFALLLAGLFALSLMVGCGGDGEDNGDDPAPANFVRRNPAGRRYCCEWKYYGYL